MEIQQKRASLCPRHSSRWGVTRYEVERESCLGPSSLFRLIMHILLLSMDGQTGLYSFLIN